jgi:hypothetical protein
MAKWNPELICPRGAAYAPQVEPGHAFGERSTIGICLKHGAFIAQVLLGGGSSECGRCKEPEGAVAANRSDRLDNSLHRAGLPDRLAMASFAGFVARHTRTTRCPSIALMKLLSNGRASMTRSAEPLFC